MSLMLDSKEITLKDSNCDDSKIELFLDENYTKEEVPIREWDLSVVL